MRSFQPIHLIRYGVPGAILLAGVLLIVVGSGPIAAAAGIVLIGSSFLVYLVDVLARLAIASQLDRDQEQRARDRFARTGRWDAPTPARSVECEPRGSAPGRSERPRRARQRSQHQDH